MPLFDYRCEACGKVEELLIAAEAEAALCACGGTRCASSPHPRT